MGKGDGHRSRWATKTCTGNMRRWVRRRSRRQECERLCSESPSGSMSSSWSRPPQPGVMMRDAAFIRRGRRVHVAPRATIGRAPDQTPRPVTCVTALRPRKIMCPPLVKAETLDWSNGLRYAGMQVIPWLPRVGGERTLLLEARGSAEAPPLSQSGFLGLDQPGTRETIILELSILSFISHRPTWLVVYPGVVAKGTRLPDRTWSLYSTGHIVIIVRLPEKVRHHFALHPARTPQPGSEDRQVRLSKGFVDHHVREGALCSPHAPAAIHIPFQQR